MVHRNAPLTPTGRLRLARCVVDEGRPLRRARNVPGLPHHRSPRGRPPPGHGVDRAAAASTRSGRCASQHESRCALRPCTRSSAMAYHRWLHVIAPQRSRSAATNGLDRGELVHVDVRKPGRVPDGGGHKILGRGTGRANQERTTGGGYCSCTPRWTTTSGWPTPKPSPTRKPPPARRFSAARTWVTTKASPIERVLTADEREEERFTAPCSTHGPTTTSSTVRNRTPTRLPASRGTNPTGQHT